MRTSFRWAAVWVVAIAWLVACTSSTSGSGGGGAEAPDHGPTSRGTCSPSGTSSGGASSSGGTGTECPPDPPGTGAAKLAKCVVVGDSGSADCETFDFDAGTKGGCLTAGVDVSWDGTELTVGVCGRTPVDGGISGPLEGECGLGSVVLSPLGGGSFSLPIGNARAYLVRTTSAKEYVIWADVESDGSLSFSFVSAESLRAPTDTGDAGAGSCTCPPGTCQGKSGVCYGCDEGKCMMDGTGMLCSVDTFEGIKCCIEPTSTSTSSGGSGSSSGTAVGGCTENVHPEWKTHVNAKCSEGMECKGCRVKDCKLDTPGEPSCCGFVANWNSAIPGFFPCAKNGSDCTQSGCAEAAKKAFAVCGLQQQGSQILCPQ